MIHDYLRPGSIYLYREGMKISEPVIKLGLINVIKILLEICKIIKEKLSTLDQQSG